MLEKAFYISEKGRFPCQTKAGTNKAEFLFDLSDPFSSFDIELHFSHEISFVRNHDYNWKSPKKNYVATEYSPKVLKLSNGCFVQANICAGIWEFDAARKKLLWRFNPHLAMPLTSYTKNDNQKQVSNARHELRFPQKPALLFSHNNAVEISRSPIAFSAIACFTDHCDYDTVESLELQRKFFKENSIRVTKGFFLNHYSKRADNASWENNSNELIQWKEDSHELAYHSLSQSIKPDKESFHDFENLLPPLEIPTWIDHGYQPYNLSMWEQSNSSFDHFSSLLSKNSIINLWNYIDSGTSTTGVINMLNPSDFTLKSYFSGLKGVKFKNRTGMLLKNIIFHFYADEKIINCYKSSAGLFKKVFLQGKFSRILQLAKSLFRFTIPLLKVFIFWNSYSKKVYRLAKYTPLIFRHRIGDAEFRIFQAIEMVDFRKSLHPDNLEKLVRESGIFIAHTYFSVPMNYHTGRMFSSPQEIDKVTARNFAALGEKIKNGQIWNPTLSELASFLSKFEDVVLDTDTNGNIIAVNSAGVPTRSIS